MVFDVSGAAYRMSPINRRLSNWRRCLRRLLDRDVSGACEDMPRLVAQMLSAAGLTLKVAVDPGKSLKQHPEHPLPQGGQRAGRNVVDP